MTRFIFVALTAGLVGCGDKDDCDDTAGLGCDTGAHADHDHDGGEESGGEETGGEETGGEETGGEETGGEETGGEAGGEEGGEEAGGEEGGEGADSCHWLDGDICVEPNEEDNAAWCEGVSGTYSADACPADAEGTCAIPAGGDYTADATAYYYNGFAGEEACVGAGGTYTALVATGDEGGEEGGEEAGGEEGGEEAGGEEGGEEAGGEETGGDEGGEDGL